MIKTRTFVVLGLVVAVLLASGVSYYASASPDGLNKVAGEQGFAQAEQPHRWANVPFAGYATRGIDRQRLSGGLAGLAGVGVTFLVAGGVVLAVRRREPPNLDGAARGPVSAPPRR